MLPNCWKPLKPDAPQRGDEISPNVTVTKVEKSIRMAHGASLNAVPNVMGNQQRRSEEDNVQRLEVMLVRTSVRNGSHLNPSGHW